MFGCGVEGCARAFAAAGVCCVCVCVVVESIFGGALGVPETLPRYVNGGSIDLQYTLEDLGGRQIFLG